MASDLPKWKKMIYLNGKNILYPKVAEIIWRFIKFDEKNL